jgi:hypothetical protein
MQVVIQNMCNVRITAPKCDPSKIFVVEEQGGPKIRLLTLKRIAAFVCGVVPDLVINILVVIASTK